MYGERGKRGEKPFGAEENQQHVALKVKPYLTLTPDREWKPGHNAFGERLVLSPPQQYCFSQASPPERADRVLRYTREMQRCISDL